MPSIARSDQWVQVYCGSLPEVELRRAVLEHAGIPTQSSDANLRLLSPGDTGGVAVFDGHLLVPADAAERALELLAAPARGEVEWSELDRAEPERANEQQRRVEVLGARVRWCAVTVLGGPIGLWLAVEYFAAARTLSQAPLGHASVKFAAAMCALWTTCLIALWPLAVW